MMIFSVFQRITIRLGDYSLRASCFGSPDSWDEVFFSFEDFSISFSRLVRNAYQLLTLGACSFSLSPFHVSPVFTLACIKGFNAHFASPSSSLPPRHLSVNGVQSGPARCSHTHPKGGGDCSRLCFPQKSLLEVVPVLRFFPSVFPPPPPPGSRLYRTIF